MKEWSEILYLDFGVNSVVVLFKVLHHVRGRLAFRNQLSKTEFADWRAIFLKVPLCRFSISEMLPEFGIVLAAGRVEVCRLRKIFKRLTCNRALKNDQIKQWSCFLNKPKIKQVCFNSIWDACTHPNFVVDGTVVIFQVFEHVCCASTFGSHFLLTQFADGKVVTHDRAVGVF